MCQGSEGPTKSPRVPDGLRASILHVALLHHLEELLQASYLAAMTDFRGFGLCQTQRVFRMTKSTFESYFESRSEGVDRSSSSRIELGTSDL